MHSILTLNTTSSCRNSLVSSLLQQARTPLPCSIHAQPARGVHSIFRQQTASVPRPQPERADVLVHSTPDSTATRFSTAQQRPTRFSKYGITGDGSCMFRACVQGHNQLQHAGQQLPSDQEYIKALELRLAVVDELRKNREDMEPFLPGIAEDFDDYLKKMSQPGVWGGEPELLMASRVLQRPISVYQATWTGPQYILTYGEEYGKTAAPMHLLWSGAHYDLLLPLPASRL